jgi:hypothetical protein
MESVLGIKQEEKGVNPRDRKPGRSVRRQGHVQGLLERGRIQHGRDRIHIDRPASHQLEAGGGIHPRVGGDDEDA